MQLRPGTALAAIVFFNFVYTTGAGATDWSHDATPAEIARAMSRVRAAPAASSATTPLHPVEDTADFAYVLMSDQEPSDEVANLRQTIAQHLPAGVKLVILTDSGNGPEVKSRYSQWIAPDRLIVATASDTTNGFWARDAFPVPVYENAQRKTGLVAARYYRDFSAWDAIAGAVGGPAMAKQDFTFVGGNILSDEDGTCFDVYSYRMFTTTQDDLKNAYGCKQDHLMKHVAGLGDVDEVLKPLSGKRMLTDAPEYQADLRSWGYKVTMLPGFGSDSYRTYVNSLIVKDTVFMPSYGVPEDAQAAQVYRGLGYQVVQIPSNEMSDEMHGSVHCQTMAYPAMSQAELLRAIGARGR